MFIPVPKTAEFLRIQATPYVDHVLPAPEDCRLLRGGLRARPAQEAALRIFEECGELVVSVALGGGKTFIYAELMEGEERPIIIGPGGLREKTIAEFKVHGYRAPTFVSLDELCRVEAETLLERLQPTFVACDEAHRLTRSHAGAKRLFRYLDKHPECKFVPGSGTFFKGDQHGSGIYRSGLVFSYALRNNGAPVPCGNYESDMWARALGDDMFIHPGPLGKNKADAREWFALRLRGWPGLLHLPDTEGVDSNLFVTAHRGGPGLAHSPSILLAALSTLEKDWELPDGTELSHPPSVWYARRLLSLGVYYQECGPPAPIEWKVARRHFTTFCRETIKAGKADTEDHVVRRFGHEYDVEAWLAVRDLHTPRHRLEVVDGYLTDVCKAWLDDGKGRGVLWLDAPLLGRWLGEQLGLPYFNDGRPFTDLAALVSVDSYGTGANLQTLWSRALLLTPFQNASDMHQLIGRHHRPGQLAEDTIFDVFIAGDVFQESWDKCLDQARDEQYVQPSSKLLIGNVTQINATQL